jgi:hypothetical protein
MASMHPHVKMWILIHWWHYNVPLGHQWCVHSCVCRYQPGFDEILFGALKSIPLLLPENNFG